MHKKGTVLILEFDDELELTWRYHFFLYDSPHLQAHQAARQAGVLEESHVIVRIQVGPPTAEDLVTAAIIFGHFGIAPGMQRRKVGRQRCTRLLQVRRGHGQLIGGSEGGNRHRVEPPMITGATLVETDSQVTDGQLS